MVEKVLPLNGQQQRALKLLFKFRFGTSRLLADVISIRPDSMYPVIESLVSRKLVTKVYEPTYRIDRRPAYYYLSKQGVTTLRRIMEFTESFVHAQYKNDSASDSFIQQCLTVLSCYSPIKRSLPAGTEVLTKAEIQQISDFPKNRPDLYIRTLDNREAIVIFGTETQPYILKKRLQEILEHFEDDEWDGEYPVIAFVLKDASSVNSFLYRSAKTLDSMGVDDSELMLVAASVDSIFKDRPNVWHSVYKPKNTCPLFSED